MLAYPFTTYILLIYYKKPYIYTFKILAATELGKVRNSSGEIPPTKLHEFLTMWTKNKSNIFLKESNTESYSVLF